MIVNNLSPFTIQIGESEVPLERGPLRDYSWRSSTSNPQINKTETFYHLRTNVKLSTFRLMKQMELILTGISELEFQALVDLPGFLNDDFFVQVLTAKAELSSLPYFEKVPREKILLERLQRLQSLLGVTRWSLNLLYTLKGNVRYDLTLKPKGIRKVNKYSGYCRNPSAIGSKRASSIFRDPPETAKRVVYVRRNLISFLLSQTEDYSLLGISAENPLYTDLLRNIRKNVPLNPFYKQLILFKPSENQVLGNLLI